MGISDLSRYDTLVNGLMTQQAQLQQLALEQTTGTTLQKPSDDPVGTSQLLGISANLAGLTAYQKNVTLVQTNMNSEDSVETSLGQLLQTAHTIAQGAAAAAPGDPSRVTAINQLNQVLQQIVSLGNTQVGDNYIFGGYATGQPPFQTGTGTNSAVLGTSLSPTVATASVGAATPPGVYQLTSDASGNVTLTNESDPTQTQTVSGVTNGTASISFASLGVTVTAGANFSVAGLNGQTIGVASGFAYQGDTNRRQVTVDAGLSIPTNHTGDQVFGNSIASIQGTIAALQTGNSPAVSTAAGQIGQAQSQVLAIQSDGGITLQHLQSIQTDQTNREATLQTQQTGIDAVSPTEVAAQLLNLQTALQAAYAATGRIENLSLVNYLPA